MPPTLAAIIGMPAAAASITTYGIESPRDGTTSSRPLLKPKRAGTWPMKRTAGPRLSRSQSACSVAVSSPSPASVSVTGLPAARSFATASIRMSAPLMWRNSPT